jgi:DNA-binding beta-propeller fold protein YncE
MGGRRIAAAALLTACLAIGGEAGDAPYRETRRIGLDGAPGGVAVDATGRILVASGSSLLYLDGDGNRLKAVELGEPPTCLAAGRGEEVLVGFRRRLDVVDGSGKRRTIFGEPGEKAFLTSVAIVGEEIFAADAGNRVVWRLDRSGRLRGKLGKGPGNDAHPGFVVPSPYFDVAPGSDGSLWVANPGFHRVENFSREGTFRSSWGAASMGTDGFAGCCNPSHIAVTRRGSFVTSEKGIPRVKIHGPDGRFDAVVAGPESFARGTEGLDLAVDAEGRILVLDPPGKALRIFAPAVGGGRERR